MQKKSTNWDHTLRKKKVGSAPESSQLTQAEIQALRDEDDYMTALLDRLELETKKTK